MTIGGMDVSRSPEGGRDGGPAPDRTARGPNEQRYRVLNRPVKHRRLGKMPTAAVSGVGFSDL